MSRIQTFTGRMIDLTDPWPGDIAILDIAHGLSQLCRFTGHTNRFYSVAEHSYRVSYVCDPVDALWGLLHDASEAYLGDVSSPLKSSLPDYRAIEKVMMATITSACGLPEHEPASVRRADRVMLATEVRDLMPGGWKEPLLEPLSMRISPMSPDTAKQLFLGRYEELTR